MTDQYGEVVDLTKVSNTFPQLGDRCILRENMSMTLVDMLQAEAEVVIVEGRDGIGKTTLLAQFVQEHNYHAFGIFVRSSSRWAYDSSMVTRELSDMIGWVLDKENFRKIDIDHDPVQLLRSRIFKLQKHANREQKTYYFVVDGLDEIPPEDSHEREAILDLLPFGLPRFRFILSGSLACLNNRAQKIGGIKPFRLPGFTFDETSQFLSGLVEDSEAIGTIHRISKHVPGNLASVRRLLQQGTDIENLLNELPEQLPDLFEMEWRTVGKDDTLLRQALSILTIDHRCHSLTTLSQLCKTDLDTLSEKFSHCGFLEVSKEDQRVEFVCDTFKRFAIKHLAALRSSTLEMIISDLLINPNSVDTLTHLPDFLNKAGRYSEILAYLTPEHIGRLIDCGDSWVPLHQKVDLGVDTALHMERDSDLLKFGLQRAMITRMESAESWRSEIEAYIALGDFMTPFALAQRMVTKEDRLQVLAVIARANKTRSLPIEVEVSDQIRQLYRSLDHSCLGERGIEIASDLLYTHPELAVELVQKCTGKGCAENRLDLALAKLSVKALTGEKDGLETTRQALRDKVKDPKIQNFIDRMALFFGEFSADRVIVEVEKWEKASDQIFALRAWAMTNAKREDAASVIEFGLATILKTTTFTASANVYLDLSSPLIYIPDIERVKNIISRLDGLRGPIESVGPTVEYVKLQSKIAESESRYCMNSSFNRLQDLFFYTEILTETSTKLSSLAVIASTLRKIDKNRKFDDIGPIHELVLEELKVVVDDILTKTASHYDAVYPAIGALAQIDTKIALEVVLKLNTAERREMGLVKLVEAIASEPLSDSSFSAIEEAYGKLQFVTMKAKAIRSALQGLLEKKEKLEPFINNIIALHVWAKAIPDAGDKCRALCTIIEILLHHNKCKTDSLVASLQKEMLETWDKVDLEWIKVDIGFESVSLLAKCSPEFSRELLSKTIAARDAIVLDNRDMAISYIHCVLLTIRCFTGLIKRKVFNENDVEILQGLVDKIPSVGARVTVWGELALKFFIAHDTVSCKKIVSEKIRPFLEDDTIKDMEARWQVITEVAPALYCAHSASAKILLNSLPQPYRDGAYSDICSFLISKRLPKESYDPASKPTVKLCYDDVLDVFGVLECLEGEPEIQEHVSLLVENIQKRFKSEFNKVQIADVLQKLRHIISVKFASLDFIKHEGYKILAEAHVARLDRSGNTIWSSLILRAKAISNLADKAYVLIGIAGELPSKENASAISLLKEAQSLIPQISFFEDRVNRYEHLAKVSADIDRVLSKECLRQAWQETISKDLPMARRRIIDFAHRLDPEFAGSLAAESDDDPGRELARSRTTRRIESLKIRERIASGQENPLKMNHDYKQQVEVAQMMLTSLNSNRISTSSIAYTRPFIKQASQMNLEDAYVMLTWIVENAVRRHADTDQANTLLRGLFHASCLSAELAFKIAQRIRSITDNGVSAARRAESSSDTLIHPGERDKAFSIIKEWASAATGFIKITDPYFGLDELDFVNLIRSVNPSVPIFILTSRKHQMKTSQPWDDAYQSHWRMKISDSDAGEVTVTVVGKIPNDEHPIHDRWWLTENNGLRFGTSANSMGMVKVSEISELDESDTVSKLTELDRYLSGIKLLGTEKLRYLSFRL